MAISRDSRKWLAAVLTCCLLVPCAAAEVPPRVLGFERTAAGSRASQAVLGRLLLGELNCTSCHQADAEQSTRIDRKPAPVLDTVGARVEARYLQRFLSDPQATKPGTTMPNVLAGRSDAERREIVDALVHFLATTGHTTHANPARQAVTRGEKLFHSVGCLACHDPRTEPAAESLVTSIPLGTLSQKYTLPGLTQFLQDPLAVRPGGRMPHLNLSPGDARDIASFLLNDLDIVSGLQYAYYEGNWQSLPDFSKLTPLAAGEADGFDLALAKRRDRFALRFEGLLTVPQEAEYLFLVGSDDGARLLIDGKVVVQTDGIHAYQQRRKKLKMKAGEHPVVVEYFEADGEESLAVEFELPGQTQLPLATLLSAPTGDKQTPPAHEPFEIDPRKAAQGREYFATLGCAACHVLNISSSPVPPKSSAPELHRLTADRGCLSEADAKAPRYGLSAAQKTAVSAALAELKQPTRKISASEQIDETLVRFNCIACHERDGLGGVEATRNAFFQSDMPEMGDEGRLPPSLTGVGAKLHGHWLQTLFDRGADDRGYMFTRMPKFGLKNVAPLVARFAEVDAGLMKPAPEVHFAAADERRVKAAGRRLVGAQGFACIKCHTFAGQRSTGIQAISLTTMTSRLRPEWFHHYLQNPLAYRPGTRMPTPFPDGQTTLPAVLDGTVNGQIAAIWSYLSDGDKATFPVGLVTGKIELVAFDEAVLYRNFIAGAGTRAIGVGFPEKLNLAFDAENMRLALLWHGGFIDAARHWTARGAGFEKPLGDKVIELPAGTPLARLKSATASWPSTSAKDQSYAFRGYRLDEKKRPTFLYSWGDVDIEDAARPVGEQDVFVMQRTLTLRGGGQTVEAALRVARADKIEQTASSSYRIDEQWVLHLPAETKPVLRQSDGLWELLVPIAWHEGRAKVELTYDW